MIHFQPTSISFLSPDPVSSGPNGAPTAADRIGKGGKFTCTKVKTYNITVPVSFGVKFKAGTGTKGAKSLKDWFETAVKADGTIGSSEDVAFSFKGIIRIKSNACPSCKECEDAVENKKENLQNR